MMLRFAQTGWCGVNLHGGGNGFYTPIAGAPSTGFTRRPECFGIQFGQSLVGARFMGATLTGAGPQVTAYALEQSGRRRIAIINKGTETVSVALPGRVEEKAMRLSGPSLDSKEGTTFGEVRLARAQSVEVKEHSGMIYEL
jgi:hypothetical protein